MLQALYINDKPGAVVGQQPFVELEQVEQMTKLSSLNLLRWLSPRTIKQHLPCLILALPFTNNALQSPSDPIVQMPGSL